MKKALTVALAALALAAPANASTKVFKDHWIQTTMDCISYASKVNCDKAYSAANAYERSLKSNSDAYVCGLMAGSTGAMASSTSLVGGKADLQESFEGSLRVCEKY